MSQGSTAERWGVRRLVSTWSWFLVPGSSSLVLETTDHCQCPGQRVWADWVTGAALPTPGCEIQNKRGPRSRFCRWSGLWTWREGHSTGHTSHITPRFLITGAVSAVSAALWPSDLFWKFHNFLQHPSFCVTSYHERKEGQIALYCQILPIAVTKLSEERARVVPSYFVLYCWDNWFKIWECI